MYTRNAIMRDAFLAIVSLALVVPSLCYGPPQTHQQQQEQGPASDVNLVNYLPGVKDYGVVVTEDYSSSPSQSALPSIVPSSPETPTSSVASARYWWQDSPFVKNDQPSILPVPSTVPPVAPIELNIVSSDAGTSGVRIPSSDHSITQVLYPNNPFLNGEVQRKTHAYTIAPTVFTPTITTTAGVKDYSSGGIEPVSSNSIAPSGYPAPAVEHTNTFPTAAPTPYPGCAAALKCVPEAYCNSQGVASDTPVTLTKEFLYNRVPLTDCLDEPTGIIGKCCRDPNYKDPWPADLPHEHGHDHGHEHGHEHEHEHEHQHTDSNSLQPEVAPKPTTGLHVIPISAYQPSSEGPKPPAGDYGGVPIGPYKPPPPPSPSPPYGGGQPQQPSLPPYQPQPTHPPHIFIPPYKPSFPPQSSSNYRPPPQQPFQPPFTPGGSQTYPGPGSQPPPHPGSGSQTYPGPGSPPPYPASGCQTYPCPGLNPHPGTSPTFPPHLPTHPPPYGGSSKPPQPPYGISKPPHTIISPPQSSHPPIPVSPPTSVYPGSPSHELTIVKPGGGSPPTYPGSPPPSYPPPNYIPSKPGYPTQIPPQYPSKPSYPEQPSPQYPTKPPYPEHPPPQYPTKPPYPEQPQPEYPSKPPYPEHPPPEYPSKPSYPEQPSPQYPTKPTYPEHPPPEYPSKPSYPEHPPPEYPSKPSYPEHPPPQYPTKPPYPEQPSSQYPTKPSYPEQPPPHYPSKPPHPEQPTPQYPQQPPTQYPYPQQPPTQYPYPQQPQYPQHPPPNYPQHPPPQYPQQPPTQYPQPAQPSYPDEPSQRFTTVQEVVEVTQAPAKYHIVNKFGGSCGTKKNDGTAHGNAPWHVIVYSSKNKDLICAGAIVSENAILTAAHCLDHSESESTEVKIGPQGKMYKVAAIARHSQYEPISFNRDLALVFLHEPIPSDEYVEKICLPSSITPQTSQAKDCYVSSMDKDFEQSTLEIMPVEVFPYKDCEIKLRNTYLGKYFILNDSFSCVSTPAEQELCSVKTGSPIACGRGDGTYELFGIKSWDLGCQQYKSSAIFSNADLIWIQNTLSTPLPKLSENEKARRKDKFRGESLEGVNIKEKPGFGQGYGK